MLVGGGALWALGRAYKQDGIWHLYKRGLGVPPPHYLTPVTAETATAILSKAVILEY